MKWAMRLRAGIFWAVLAAVTLAFGSGCVSPRKGAAANARRTAVLSDLLQVGEVVSIGFSGISDPPQKQDVQITENGMINLPLVGTIKAAGKKLGQLQQEVHDLYVPRFYQHLTVTVSSESRFFFVRGQVHNPNRFPYLGEVTVLKAIAAAGDFTDFANRKKVELRRANGQIIRINAVKAEQNPDLDLPVFPGDQIFVPRRYI